LSQSAAASRVATLRPGAKTARAITVARMPARRQLQIAHGGHQQYIAQIRTPGSGQVVVRKTQEAAFGTVTARRSVPSVVPSIRRELYPAEWHAGFGMHVSVLSRADQGIHLIHRGLGGANGESQNKRQAKKVLPAGAIILPVMDLFMVDICSSLRGSRCDSCGHFMPHCFG